LAPAVVLGFCMLCKYLGIGEKKNTNDEDEGENQEEATSNEKKSENQDSDIYVASASCSEEESIYELKKEEFSPDDDIYEKEKDVKDVDIKPETIRKGQWNEILTMNESDLTKKLESLSARERVIYAIKLARERYGTGGKHCGDWKKRLFRSMGVVIDSCQTGAYQNLKYEGQDCGDVHASDWHMDRIETGDSIWYNVFHKTGKSPSKKGNHSVIFIKWINKKKRIALVSGYTAKHNKSLIHQVKFNEKPITHIGKPKIKGPINLEELKFLFRNEKAKAGGFEKNVAMLDSMIDSTVT